jgi:5-methylthioadenosine/S-adenosylhomocysteine deaminase
MKSCWWISLAFLTFTLPAAGWQPTDGLILKGDVATMDAQLNVIPDGQVVILGEKIVAVLKAGEAMPSSVSLPHPLVINTEGYILPGLIDLHNHVEYNVLPLWTVPKLYTNRYKWSSGSRYKADINGPKKLLTEGAYMDQDAEAIKYAEVKALIAGTTSIQGTPDLKSTRILVRNIENNNFGSDRIYARALSIDEPRFKEKEVPALVELMDQRKVDAWIVHLAEGIDPESRSEFASLKKLKLLRDITVIIHGTALQSPEFHEMANAGAKLVWSPLSNLLLYGKTTDIPAALSAGLVICLGVDWSPSGSKNLLGELKIAHEYDKAKWDHKLSDTDLVKMVTVNPAIASGLDDKIGRIKADYYADIAVFKKNRPDPYRNLIEATERDVQLVLVGGTPYYGDLSFMKQLKGQDYEALTIGGVQKGLDVTDPAIPLGTEKFSEFEGTLTKALLADPTYLHQHFGIGMTDSEFQSFLDKQFPGLHALVLDSLVPDKAFFDALRQSTNAHLSFDVERYWNQGGQSPTSEADALLLALVNDVHTTFELLDNDVGINSLAAKSIIEYRNGSDGSPGTADDRRFNTVEELNNVRHVGQSTLNLLRTYAASHSH